ncbi:MAG: hypothetical protein NC328_04390 [Muribaculum sp.]|nr:hypothetical protein [Muribaculum sp.]
MEDTNNIPPNIPHEAPKKDRSILIGSIVLGVVLVATVVGVIIYHNRQKRQEHALRMEQIDREEALERLEQAREDSLSMEEEAREKEYESRVNKFNSLVSALKIVPMTDMSYYMLYDITGDGEPELFANTGTCEADATMHVFTAPDGVLKKLGTFGTGHGGITGGDKSVYLYMMHMGTAMEWRITTDGSSLHESKIYESSMYDDDGMINENWEPRNPSGRSLTDYNFADINPIRRAFGLD